MPQATAARSAPRRRRIFRKKNPAKTVKEWELTRLRKQVKRMMPKPEWKYADIITTGTTITTTATITNLIPLAQGSSDDDRQGDKVTWRSLFHRMSVTPNATAGVNFLRVMIIQDKQNNGTAPTAAQIFQTSTNYLSPLNDDFGKRFKVLFDRTYTVDTDANGAQVDKIYRKLRIVTEYAGAGSVVPNTNGIYLVQLSDQATNGPTTSTYTRLRYIDP